jgi:PIN domain nuclease of toxin-antitoxin system
LRREAPQRLIFHWEGSIYALSNLPNHHRDPFDRILIAQSMNEDLQILSIDEKFDAYGVKRLW